MYFSKHLKNRFCIDRKLLQKYINHIKDDKNSTLYEIIDMHNTLKKLDVEISDTKELLKYADLKHDIEKDISICDEKTLEITDNAEYKVDTKNQEYAIDSNKISLELIAAVGGQESSLFANELFNLYLNYCEYLGVGVNVVNAGKTEIGGFRKIQAEIIGESSLIQKFEYESGIHRVQRVPQTEKQGRIHTSTIAVSVLPIFIEKIIDIPRNELVIDTFKSQGKGGQHVNATDSAVRIKHVPTGITVECQEERSQIENRQRALKNLKNKITDSLAQKEINYYMQSRNLQRGTLARSEKIRTYNFPQDRITDHRLDGATGNFYGLKKIFNDNALNIFHTLIQNLDTHFKQIRLSNIFSKY